MSQKERLVAALLLAVAVAGGALIPRLLASPPTSLGIALGPGPSRSVVQAPAIPKPARRTTPPTTRTHASVTAGQAAPVAEHPTQPTHPTQHAQRARPKVTKLPSPKPRGGRGHAPPPTPPTTTIAEPAALQSDNSSCDGSYEGTANNVTVPNGATCTLAPGTTVNHDLTVQPGGTLINRGVTVGHDLVAQSPAGIAINGDSVGHDLRIERVSGSAQGSPNTICDTTVGHDLVVQGGADSASQFVIGDSGNGCSGGGNKVGHDLVVTGNQNVVAVADNSVGHKSQIQDGSSSDGHANTPPSQEKEKVTPPGHENRPPGHEQAPPGHEKTPPGPAGAKEPHDVPPSGHGKGTPQAPPHPVGDHHRHVGHLAPPPPSPAPPTPHAGPKARPKAGEPRGKGGHGPPTPVAHGHGPKGHEKD